MIPASRLLAMLAVLLAVPFMLAACGGDDGDSDEDKITEVIETSATGTDPADCTELQTQAFNEQTTFETGEAATASCEEDAADTSNDPESVEVANVEVDGKSATAEVTFTGGGFDGSTLAVSLVKEDDQWKLDAIDDIPDFNAEGLKADLSKQLAADDELTPQQKDCISQAITGADEETLKSVALGDQDALIGLFGACG
ncbi:MAG: Rv0361 family membrane protein [Solirubrobacterales bacterium]